MCDLQALWTYFNCAIFILTRSSARSSETVMTVIGLVFSAIIEYDDCWKRTDIQATWTSCINEFSASLDGSQDGLCR